MPLTNTSSPGRLLDAGEQPADHHGVGAGDQGLGDVAGVLQAAVGDHRHAGRAGGQRRPRRSAVTCGTPTPATTRVVQIEPGPTPTLTASAPASISACAPARVAMLPPTTSTPPSPAEVGLHPGDHVEHGALVAVRGVDDDHVDPGVDQQAGPLVGVLAHAERGADDQPAVGVLGGVGVLVALDEVLDRDQPAQPAGVVDQRQLLDLVLAQQRQRGVRVDPDRAR